LIMALTAIEGALSAMKLIGGSESRLLEVPDHRVRLEAVGLFVRLLATPAFTAEKLPALRRNVYISSEIENRRSRVVGPAHHKAKFSTAALYCALHVLLPGERAQAPQYVRAFSVGVRAAPEPGVRRFPRGVRSTEDQNKSRAASRFARVKAT
jgi:hypothetical protein